MQCVVFIKLSRRVKIIIIAQFCVFSFVTTTKLWDNLLRILNFIESFLFSLLLALSLCILSNKNHWIVLWKYSSWELVLSIVPNVFIHCFVRFLRMRLLCTCAFFLSSFTWCSTIASCALDCAPSNVSFILFWCRAFGISSHVLCTAIIMLSQICNGITYSYTISWMYVCLLIIFISLLHFISVLYYLLFRFCRALLVRYVALGMFSLLYLKWRNLSKNIQPNSKYTFGMAFLWKIMSFSRNGNDSNCCIRHIFGKTSWIMISVISTLFSPHSENLCVFAVNCTCIEIYQYANCMLCIFVDISSVHYETHAGSFHFGW